MTDVKEEGLASLGNWGFIIFLILILLIFGMGLWGIN